jgi:hypothetical protein
VTTQTQDLEFVQDRAQDAYDQARADMRGCANAIAESVRAGQDLCSRSVERLIEAEVRAHAWDHVTLRIRALGAVSTQGVPGPRAAVTGTLAELRELITAPQPDQERPTDVPSLSSAMATTRHNAWLDMIVVLSRLLDEIDFELTK